jgi:NAD(P)-dependent dehydrogenase (short-subunit alcohol dehydrogenase family)
MTQNFAIYPSLNRRAVLISGGATGIGAEIVRAFAAQNAVVGFLDFDRKAGAALAAELGVHFEYCDLRNIDETRAAIQALREQIGPFHALVNNAARDDRHDWQDVTPEYWDERMATNLRHQFFVSQAIAPDMIAAGGGVIVNMGSCSWWEAMGGFPAYATTKAAVHGLTRTLARDLGRHHIRVNTVVPGHIMTQRQKDLWSPPEFLQARKDRQCLPTLIEPEYVARMVLFLCSEDAAMCSAHNFFVDGGSV